LSRVIINTKEPAEDAKRFGKFLEQNGFEVEVVEDSRFRFGLTTDQELINLLEGASAVVAGSTPYTAKVLQNLPNLRVIARTGVGFDKIDIGAATANHVVVTVTPKANYEAVAEQAMGMLIGLAKSMVSVDKNTRLGRWPSSPGKPIRGSVLGIVGLGRIGRNLAVRAQAMKMQVIAAESEPDHAFVRERGVKLVSLPSLFENADYISLHCPLTDETKGMINNETLALMKPGVSIVNTARGGLIIEKDLVHALKTGLVDSAGLDVFEQEPPSVDNPLYELDNVILSAHVAGSDHLSRKAAGEEASNYIVDLANGRWPEGAVVNSELKAKWCW
jgi:phosphoglycerate dehydrogenase-like enzyme